MPVTASARKTADGYKPIIKFPNGRTLVVEQSPERFDTHTKKGVIPGNRYAQGNVYADRDEAIEAAQAYIRRQLADAMIRREKYGAANQHIAAEIALWGGT